MIEPLDDAELGEVAADGLPPPILYRGYGVGPAHPITVFKYHNAASAWLEYHTTSTANTKSYDTVYSEGLFEWGALVGYNEVWEVAPVGETVVTRSLVVEADPAAPGAQYPTHTFDAAGMACLMDKVAGGTDPVDAANQCATGETLTNTFTVPRGSILMVDNVGLQECAPNTIEPYPHEADHLMASRFTPPTYPYQLERVAYVVGSGLSESGTRCDASLPHEVLVFLAKSGAPPDAMPELVAQITAAIPLGGTDGAHPNVVELEKPEVVQSGDEVYVALRMPHTGDRMLCALTCDPPEYVEPDRHWWSNAIDPPYPWSTLQSFSLDRFPQIRLIGRAL